MQLKWKGASLNPIMKTIRYLTDIPMKRQTRIKVNICEIKEKNTGNAEKTTGKRGFCERKHLRQHPAVEPKGTCPHKLTCTLT